jgi:hypothetical protein
MTQGHNRFREAVRGMARAACVLSLLAAMVVGWEAFVGHVERAAAAPAPHAPEWGAEALAALPGHPLVQSVIAPANACGLGASSCFKCHNGFRAKAPSDGAWHGHHDSVDQSCVGCHKGNARLAKQELAHRNLIRDPRKQPGETCAGCHRGADAGKFLSAYGIGK